MIPKVENGNMNSKRKPSYEQDRALAKGRLTARANQRARMAQKEADERLARERADELARRDAEPKPCPSCGRYRRHDEFCTTPDYPLPLAHEA